MRREVGRLVADDEPFWYLLHVCIFTLVVGLGNVFLVIPLADLYLILCFDWLSLLFVVFFPKSPSFFF